MAYSNFDLRISVPDKNGRYQITAESPYGQTPTINQQVLPTDDEFTDLLSYLHDLVAHPG